MEYFFFLLFGLSLIGMYVAVRRQLAPPGFTAGIGVVASIVFMTLFMLIRGTSTVQGIIMGILIGSLFAGATLAIAWYFHSNEMRENYIAQGAGGGNVDLPTEPLQQEEATYEEYYDNVG